MPLYRGVSSKEMHRKIVNLTSKKILFKKKQNNILITESKKQNQKHKKIYLAKKRCKTTTKF